MAPCKQLSPRRVIPQQARFSEYPKLKTILIYILAPVHAAPRQRSNRTTLTEHPTAASTLGTVVNHIVHEPLHPQEPANARGTSDTENRVYEQDDPGNSELVHYSPICVLSTFYLGNDIYDVTPFIDPRLALHPIFEEPG